MKRTGGLWERITSFENLYAAARQARKGKRVNPVVMAFEDHLEENLLLLRQELLDQSYLPGSYNCFEIFEPKPRLISAAPYRDRVVHHALVQVIGPIFESTFIRDSYANRTGFGTHRALWRFTQFLRSSRYVLQCDIRKFFPSLDQEVLKALLRRKLKCSGTLWLLDTILDTGPDQPEAIVFFPGDTLFTPYERRRGLPIGNLTSQFLANVYLNPLDHFVKETLGMGKYVRYVDDFALFDNDRARLEAAQRRIAGFLAGIRLSLHLGKTRLADTRDGACFVGFRILQDRIRIRKGNLRRGRRRLRQMAWAYGRGRLPWEKVQERIHAWLAHLAHADSWHLRENVLSHVTFHRDRACVPPGQPGRELEQQQ